MVIWAYVFKEYTVTDKKTLEIRVALKTCTVTGKTIVLLKNALVVQWAKNVPLSWIVQRKLVGQQNNACPMMIAKKIKSVTKSWENALRHVGIVKKATNVSIMHASIYLTVMMMMIVCQDSFVVKVNVLKTMVLDATDIQIVQMVVVLLELVLSTVKTVKPKGAIRTNNA